MSKQYTFDEYNTIRKSLVAELMKDLENKELITAYETLTKDKGLMDLKAQMVDIELDKFLKNIDRNKDFSMDSNDVSDSTYYLKFDFHSLERLNFYYKDIEAMLTQLSAKYEIEFCPEYAFYKHINSEGENKTPLNEIQPLKPFKDLDIELN